MKRFSFILNRHGLASGGLTFGQRAADAVANGMGSWRFILWQTAGITAWIIMNGAQAAWMLWSGKPFDPYPYILLNLLFSTQAAYAAPIIMMSQNRAAIRDRKTAEDTRRIVAHIEDDEEGLKARMDELAKGHAQIIALLKPKAQK
jgi:uncharacterized membrane protein